MATSGGDQHGMAGGGACRHAVFTTYAAARAICAWRARTSPAITRRLCATRRLSSAIRSHATDLRQRPTRRRETPGPRRSHSPGRGGAELLSLVDEVAPRARAFSRAAASSVENLRYCVVRPRALGSGYVRRGADARADAAIEVTGAERGFIMLANPENVLVHAGARVAASRFQARRDTSLKIRERVYHRRRRSS